jgi:PAS domain S-box-containing protein
VDSLAYPLCELAPPELADIKFALDHHVTIVVTDIKGTIVYVNDLFCAISRYTKQELVGRNHRMFNSCFHQQSFFEQMFGTIAAGHVWKGEFKNRAKDGSIYWLDTTIVPLIHSDGKPRQYVAIGTDITKKATAIDNPTALEALTKQLADQQFALDQHAIVAMTDVRGKITYVNEKFCAISQYSKEELLGQNHRILNSNYHPKEFFRQMYSVIARGAVWRGEIKNRAKDGSFYWVDTTIVPTQDRDGKPERYVAIRTDITERKSEEEVRERLALVVESSQDAIISKDLNGRILSWNGGAEQIFGYPASEAIGRSILMLIPEERTHEEKEILNRISRGDKLEHFETVRVRKDGTRVDISTTISPIKNRDGLVVGASKIARDITANKQAQQEIRSLNATLASRNHQLAEQAEALVRSSEELERRVAERTVQLAATNNVLEQSNIELQRFAYVASHDLQSPLRSIGGFVQLLKMKYQGRLDEEALDWIDRTVHGIARMQALIQDLLEYSRVDSHPRPFSRRPLQELLKQTLENLHGPILNAGAQITWDELPMALCDPGQIVQLLDNLIGNALKYHGRESPRIHISAESAGDLWTVTVRDNGIGIAPEYHQQIFELFRRLHDNKSYAGTGIGLAICRKIVEHHGGKLWVESEEGDGSAFKFTIASESDGNP